MKFNGIVLLLFLLITPIYTFNCGANQIKDIKINKVSQPVNKRKLKIPKIYTPIQIKMDYTYLDSQKNSAELTSKVKQILDKTIVYFSKLLSIKHTDFSYLPQHFKAFCKIPVFDSSYQSYGYYYDLVIIPYFSDTIGTSVQAAATACVAISQTMQPKMGVIMINPNLDFSHYNSERFLEMLFLHEMSHVLIFHQAFFLSLDMMKQEIVNEEVVYYIKTPTVLEKAKLHFGCNSITGIPLENYGGAGSAGSHWESRYLLGDYMIATDYPEIVISDISLAVFEDSGFYKVNYYTGGLFRFGKGEGCSFFNKKCIIDGGTPFANEFCIKSQEPFCTAGHLSKGHCYIGQYGSVINSHYQYFKNAYVGGYAPADYCPISFDNLYDKSEYYFPTNCKYGKTSMSHPDYGEKVGNNSVCMESSLVPTWSNQGEIFRSICYEILCNENTITVWIGSRTIECPKSGGLIENPSGFRGKVVCPDYNSVCTSDVWCSDPLECIDKNVVADTKSYYYTYSLPSKEGSDYYLSNWSITSFLLIMALFI